MVMIGFADGTEREIRVPTPKELAELKEQILTDDGERGPNHWGNDTMLGVILALDATSDFAMTYHKWIVEHGQHGPSCEGNRRTRNLDDGKLDRGPCTCGLSDLAPAADDRIDTGGTNA